MEFCTVFVGVAWVWVGGGGCLGVGGLVSACVGCPAVPLLVPQPAGCCLRCARPPPCLSFLCLLRGAGRLQIKHKNCR